MPASLLETAKAVVAARLAAYDLAVHGRSRDAAVDMIVRTVLGHVMQPSAARRPHRRRHRRARGTPADDRGLTARHHRRGTACHDDRMRTTVASAGEPLLVQVDGRAGAASDVGRPQLLADGHLTAAQVRGGGIRGLDLHLARLGSAHREMFGTELDTEQVRTLMRQAVAAHPDCYLRVTVDEPSPGVPRVVTVVRRPLDAPTSAQSLAPTAYVRARAHLKHTGSFGTGKLGDAAVRAGFDDALLVAPDGQVAETSIANIGFLRGRQVVWPAWPSLHGITWQLLDEALAQLGRPAVTERVSVADKRSFDGAFLANSLGVAPVGRIGTHLLADPGAAQSLVALYDEVPFDRV